MAYQSKTYSLSDEVVAAIDAAKANGETPNKFLRRVLGIDKPDAVILHREQRPVFRREHDDAAQLDATGPPLAQGRGKATTIRRGPNKGERLRG